MTRATQRNVVGLVGVLTLCLSVPAPAHAADALVAPAHGSEAPAGAVAPVNAENDQTEARRLFQRAELSFNLGKFAEALADYQSAYQARPLPGFLFNIAQCYRNMGDFERARFFFRRYLALEPRTPNHRRVEELISEMTKQLDGRQAEPPRAAVAPGTVEAKPPDPPVAVGPVVARVPVALVPTTTSSPAPMATLAAAPAAARRPVWKRWWFWTGVGAVVAGGVLTTLLLTKPDVREPGTLPPIDAR